VTGPEHYREAENLLVSCQLIRTDEHEIYPEVGLGHEDDVDSCRNALMAAQVHATLALTAAQAEPIAQSLGTEGDEIATAWSEAIS
jgi:hypothetical protein